MLICLKCDNRWEPRIEHPKRCPMCCQPKWWEPRRKSASHAKNAGAEAGKPAPEIPEEVPKVNHRRPSGKLARSPEGTETSDAYHLGKKPRSGSVGPLIEQAVQAKKYSHDPSTCRNRFCLVCAATKE